MTDRGRPGDRQDPLDPDAGAAADDDPGKTQIDPLDRASFDAGAQAPSRIPSLFRTGEVVAGRYRVIRFLDEGGMGAVYEVEDEELGGRLALKAILPELGYRQKAVGRFRREIQLSRKVTHPRVCRVFDVGRHTLEERGIEVLFLTMELLSGETLSQRLKRDGPMPPEEAANAIRQIASALQAAHDVGVVHRDLKSSNVMVEETGEGLRAVVTDFGLSRSILEAGDSGITASGHMVGTPAYAAPEQIAGKEPTPACDVYSMGLVFYEMLTGKLPYADESPYIVAIQRLQGDPLPTPAELGIDVDPVWESAIQRCLAIDPEERFASPREFLEVMGGAETPTPTLTRSLVTPTSPAAPKGPWKWLAGLLLVGLLAGVAWRYLRPTPVQPPPTLRVVVAPVEAPEAEDVFVGSEVGVALERSLIGLERVNPVDSGDVVAVEGGVADLIRATAADEAMVSRVEDRGSEWDITLRRILADGSVQWSEDFAAPKGDARLLASAVAVHVGNAYPGYSGQEGATGRLEVRPRDYEEYLRWHRVLETRSGNTDWEEVAEGLAGIRSGSPRFVDAYLMEARIVRYLFTKNRNPEYLARAYQLVELARQMSPRDPRPLLGEIHIAYTEGDLDRVQETIQDLEELHPGELEVLRARALLAERRGELDEARTYLQRVVERHEDWNSLMDLASLEAKAGRYDEARSYLQRVLELSPGNRSALRKLGELELQHGSLQRAEELYSSLLEGGSDGFLWTNLGVSQLLQRDYDAARLSFLRASEEEPDDPVARLNLADVESLLGRTEEANRLYHSVVDWSASEAFGGGWEDMLLVAQSLAHLGHRDQAIGWVQRDEVQAAKRPQAWFEISLVFILVGDEASALHSAQQALESGINPRWFGLPWFDAVRQELEAVTQGS